MSMLSWREVKSIFPLEGVVRHFLGLDATFRIVLGLPRLQWLINARIFVTNLICALEKKNIVIIKMYSINPETSFDLIALYSFCEYDRM